MNLIIHKKGVLTLALQMLIPVVFLCLWEMFASESKRMAFVFGTPKGIFAEFSSLLKSRELFPHIWATLSAALLGCFIGTFLGTLTGVALSMSKTVFKFAEPYVLFIGSLPVFALGPLMIFWFGTGLASKVALVILVTYAISVLQSYNGAKNADKSLIDMLKVFGADNLKIARFVRVPSSVSWVLAGLRINIGMALIGAVIGEFIASRVGLGHLIVVGEGLYKMNLIWVGVITVSFLALLLNYIVSFIENRFSSYTNS